MQPSRCFVQPGWTALQREVWRLPWEAAVMTGFMTVVYLGLPWGPLYMQRLQRKKNKHFTSLNLNARRGKEAELPLSALLLGVSTTLVL